MENLALYGIPLGLLIISAVKVGQDEFKFSDKVARWARGLLGMGAFLLIANADVIQAAWPYFETAVVQAGGALAVLLSVLGYWPEAQRVAYRAMGKL